MHAFTKVADPVEEAGKNDVSGMAQAGSTGTRRRRRHWSGPLRAAARPQARARMFARSRQRGALGNRQLRSGHTTNDFHRSARLGPPSGGTFVDLFGSNFVSGSTVTFDE